MQNVVNLCETRVIDVTDETIQNMITENPELSKTIIPAGMYAGITRDISTFGVKAVIVTTTDADEEVVYNFIKLIFENLDYIKKLHPVFSNLYVSSMIKEGQIAPYHAGALRYYQEKKYNISQTNNSPPKS